MDEAKKVHPKAQWWLKADGCDLITCLGDSVNHEWTGDVDLNDGKVADQHANFLKRLAHIDGMCRDMTKIAEQKCTLDALKKEQNLLQEDISFLNQCTLHDSYIECTYIPYSRKFSRVPVFVERLYAMIS